MCTSGVAPSDRARGGPHPAAHSTQPRLSSGKASATEARYSKLKEKHSELINTHAELLRKVGARLREGRVGRVQSQNPRPLPSRMPTRPSS